MDKVINLTVSSPWRIEFQGPVSKVVSRGAKGGFCILPGHAPFLVEIEGVRFTLFTPTGGKGGEEEREFYIEGGFLRVDFNESILIVEKFREMG